MGHQIARVGKALEPRLDLTVRMVTQRLEQKVDDGHGDRQEVVEGVGGECDGSAVERRQLVELGDGLLEVFRSLPHKTGGAQAFHGLGTRRLYASRLRETTVNLEVDGRIKPVVKGVPWSPSSD